MVYGYFKILSNALRGMKWFILLLLFACATPLFDPCDLNEDGEINMIERKLCSNENTTHTTPSHLVPGADNTSLETTFVQPDVDYNYAQFVLNVHDIVYPNLSAQSINDTITLHETYNVPIDIYLTGPTLHRYIAEQPWIIERMQESDVVYISYHFRPPHPLYTGFDHNGILDLSYDDLYVEIENYNRYKLDLETAEYIEGVEGGYELVKSYFGAPWCVGHTVGANNFNHILAELYSLGGSKFTVSHGRDYNLGETDKGLFYRPEHAEIKWYEEIRAKRSGQTAENVILDYLSSYGDQGYFVNIKMHENNYYTVGTPFAPIYWVDGDKSNPNTTPYNLSLGNTTQLRPPGYYEEMFEWYEDALRYVTDNPGMYKVMSPEEVYALLE